MNSKILHHTWTVQYASAESEQVKVNVGQAYAGTKTLAVFDEHEALKQ